MNELCNEISAIIIKLEGPGVLEGSVEQLTLNHLKELMAAAENAEDTLTLAARIAELEQFWASSVPWCSELSKDIEKIIIMHKELL